MTGAGDRGWGPGWPTERTADQVKISRAGSTPTAISVHRGIAPLVAEGLRSTEEEIRYDVRMLGGYCSRPIRGSTSTPSNHSWGLAVDINWDKNPMLKSRLVTDLPAQMVTAWKALGFAWGGDYRTRKDSMHFEFMGTPAQAAALAGQLGVAPVGEASQAPAPEGAPRPLLRKGAKGQSVKLLQGRLCDHALPLKVDGDYGAKTLGAVIAFQKRADLLPDGVVGGKTWGALG